MKKLFIIVFLFSFGILQAQDSVDSLVQIGINYHDRGEYEMAVEMYNKALAIDSESLLVHYELAMTYMYLGDYEKSIKHSDVIIDKNDKYVLLAYITKGSSLDNLGKTQESIDLFKKAIEEFGDNYLVYYNLAVSYNKLGDHENSESAFIKAITNNPNHASSHFGLAEIKYLQNERVQSLLGFYYFLLLEPSSERSKTAYRLLKQQLGGNVSADEDNPKNITITLDSSHASSEFGAVELMLAMSEASKYTEKNKEKTEDELFIESTKIFFGISGELREKETKDNIWWNFYVPFFYKLSKDDFVDVFCYYISLNSNPNAMEWIKNNIEKAEEFGSWLNISKQ